MNRIVALGESARVAGYALAGVTVVETDVDGPAAAWAAMPEDTVLVLLTPAAAAALEDQLSDAGRRLWTVMPA